MRTAVGRARGGEKGGTSKLTGVIESERFEKLPFLTRSIHGLVSSLSSGGGKGAPGASTASRRAPSLVWPLRSWEAARRSSLSPPQGIPLATVLHTEGPTARGLKTRRERRGSNRVEERGAET